MNKSLEFLQKQVGKDASKSPSPLMKWLNATMLSAEEGKLSFQYQIRKEMTNPIGNLHGGITAAIIDDAIGATTFSFGEEHFYSTINLAVDYFGTATVNDTIIAETTVIKKGRQLINAQCEIWNADKTRMLAKGYSNLLKTTVTKPTV
jgi:acyl-coenzyme A thioesterase 13